MAGPDRQFFMTQKEFCHCIRSITEELSLSVILMSQHEEVLRLWCGTDEELINSGEIYLVMGTPDLARIDMEDFQPARLGWVEIDIPRQGDKILLVCQISAKTDWYDRDDHIVHRNPASAKLFNKIWRKLRRSLSFPIWARNIKYGGEASYNDTGYSEGAAELFRCGYDLMQEGVANVRFEIRDERH